MNVLDELRTEASAGRLVLRADVADRCAAACASLATDLQGLKNSTRLMSTVGAYGVLGSAQTLGAKFERKAVGDNGMHDVLEHHIDTVLQLRDVFDKAGRAYREADARAADMVASTTGGAAFR